MEQDFQHSQVQPIILTSPRKKINWVNLQLKVRICIICWAKSFTKLTGIYCLRGLHTKIRTHSHNFLSRALIKIEQ